MNSIALPRALMSTSWRVVSATSTAAPSRAGFLASRCYATRAAKTTTTATATTPKATAATKKTTTTTAKKNVSTTTAASKKNTSATAAASKTSSAKATSTTANSTTVAASSTTPKATKTVKKTTTPAAATKTATTAATKKTATNKAAAAAPKAPTTNPVIATSASAPNPTPASTLTRDPSRHVTPTSPLPSQSLEQEVRPKLNPNSKEYRKAYGTAARKWTSAMVAMPILLVTSYYLFDRLALGNKPKVMPDLEGTRKHAEVEAEAVAQAKVA
ncbi:hypothetical protein CI238_08351 [Colletotrichum incanum]|uniref:Uncharacterized protein n=1 Tax=Colletotrichum incanum TaxID=1573173 RepID=A0A167AHW1_COLIC|nr:hypothetical protein CI238_08351 [Colletotrichum incanum]OHW94034.1 hypothetical protein CSPAE12_07386 [Colletotrichum incanum]